MKFILAFLNPFHKPTAAQMREQLIEEYERHLLEAENAAAYQAKMAQYYKEALNRMDAGVAKQNSMLRAA